MKPEIKKTRQQRKQETAIREAMGQLPDLFGQTWAAANNAILQAGIATLNGQPGVTPLLPALGHLAKAENLQVPATGTDAELALRVLGWQRGEPIARAVRRLARRVLAESRQGETTPAPDQGDRNL